MFGKEGGYSAFKEPMDILGRGFGLTKGQNTFAVFFTALPSFRLFRAAGTTCAGDRRRMVDLGFGFFGSSWLSSRHSDGSGSSRSHGSSG